MEVLGGPLRRHADLQGKSGQTRERAAHLFCQTSSHDEAILGETQGEPRVILPGPQDR